MFFFFQAEDGIRDATVTGVQTCALPICDGRDRLEIRGRQLGQLRTSGRRRNGVLGNGLFPLRVRERQQQALRLQRGRRVSYGFVQLFEPLLYLSSAFFSDSATA